MVCDSNNYKDKLKRNNMRAFFKFIGLWVFAFALIFFDAWCYMVVYNNGVWSLLASLQIYPPALSFSFFLMLSVVIAYLWRGKAKEKVELNTSEGWLKVMEIIFNKLFWVGLIVLFNVIMF